MRILQLSPKIPFPPKDGHTKSIFGVTKYLSLRGHKIDLVAYRQKVNADTVKDEIEKYASLHVLDVQTDNNIIGAFLNLFSHLPYNLSKYKRKELKDFLRKFFIENNVDIVHVTNSHLGWVFDILREMTNAPIILRQENLELMIMKRYYEKQKNPLLKFYSFLQYKKFLNYEPPLCAKFDKCIMMSKEDEKRLLELNPNVNTAVIPLGVESDLLNLEKICTEPNSLFYIGSLDWFPNLDGINWFLQEIFPPILKALPQTKLYLYGGGSTKNLTIPNEVKNNVMIKGYILDIWNELKNKSLAIIPLRIGSGIRVKILEMLAAGHNIITTSLGKEGIPVENGRELLIADSAREFAEKIINFLSGKYDSHKMSASGKDLIRQNYLWEVIAEKFEKTYKSLIHQETN